MLISSKTCEYIRPDSSFDSEAADYEYYIIWLGVDGGAYCWMFTDYEREKKISGEVVNTNSKDSISKFYKSAENSVTVYGENLSYNEHKYLSDITRAVLIRRYYRDGTYENLSIITSQFKKKESDFRYDFQIELQEVDSNIMK